MSEVGRKSTFPQHSFSWDVLSPRVAKKQLDRSAFLHHGTGVPAAITWFFWISKSGPRSPEVSLVFNGRTFDARIPVDNEGRYRLFWKNDFASALGQAFPNCVSAYQQKLNPNQDAWMQFEKVSAARYEVTFSTERSARVVWDDGVEQDDAKPARRRSQGRNLSPGKCKAIEEWAVTRAKERFTELDLRDVGSTKSWDLEDTSFDPPVRIEVKGSTLRLDKVTLTDKEVEHAKEARDEGICRLILVVVEEIELREAGGEDEWIPSGGEVRVWDPWEIDKGGLEPVQWRYRLGRGPGR